MHDVVVIGSGAGGGTTVKVLTDLGVNVLLLEAGPSLNPARDFKEHQTPAQYPDRGAGTAAEAYFGRGPAFGFFAASFGGWELPGEPYTVAQGQRVPLVPLAHHRGTHAALRPHLAALLRLRFQAVFVRRTGHRLADQL